MYTNILKQCASSDKKTTSLATGIRRIQAAGRHVKGHIAEIAIPSRSYQTSSFVWAAKHECFLCRNVCGRWIRDYEDARNRHGPG